MMKKIKGSSKFKLRMLSSALLLSMAYTVQADCPLDGQTPMTIGPHSPQTTFPLWIQDSEGLALEICPGTDTLNCISVPPFVEANFPGDPLYTWPPKSQVERSMNVTRWSEFDIGGHFAALEQPTLFAEDVLGFVDDL